MLLGAGAGADREVSGVAAIIEVLSQLSQGQRLCVGNHPDDVERELHR